MKVSKTIWVQNKRYKKLISRRQPETSVFRLLCTFFVAFIVSGCNFWPDTYEREVSVSHRISKMPPGIDRYHLTHLLEISKKRYVELKNAGAMYCLPGQMLRIRKKHDLVEHEIDGGLFFDARVHLKDLFNHLYNMKNQVENNNPSPSCYKFYADSNEDALQTLGVWEDSAEINTLMEGK